MTTHRSSTSLSRRTALASLAGAGLALPIAAMRDSLAAQEATPSGGGRPWQGHPVIGTWQWNSEPVGPSLAIVSVDGTYLEYDELLGIGIGLWGASGDRTAEVFIRFQQAVRDWSVFRPGYSPEPPTFRMDIVATLVTVRMTVEIDENQNAATATGRLEARNVEGDVVDASSTIARRANRLQINPAAAATTPET